MTETTNERIAEYREIIKERLGIEVTDEDPDPLIGMPQIARLSGLRPGTIKQMRQRTRLGQTRRPFPTPPPGIGDRFPDKPLWHAVSQIIPHLEATGNWPPERGARPATRVPRTPAEAA